ncbi:MAG: bifunctional 5,10-methylenetetrahydrofolate dehydrogenase/5,10-methenyltetrahydrofolate cyclohydrolase [Myxococcota bacterium]
MTTVVSGKKLAEEIRTSVRERALALEGGPTCLATVRVGDDPASEIYVRNKGKAARECGLDSRQIALPAETSQAELLDQVARLNEDPKVHGILVQLPLPDAIDPAVVVAAILPEKDVDGLHPQNAGLLLKNEPCLHPCTPEGILFVLDRHGIEIEGAGAVVIGRSEIVGKPVSLLLLHRHATVTMCHSRTRDLGAVVRRADIVVAAVGVPRLVKGDWIKPGAAIIDVGTNRVDGKLVGDVDFDAANGIAGLLTPVPGGIGPLTIAMLLRNTLAAFELQAAPRGS